MNILLIGPTGLFRDGVAAILRAFSADTTVRGYESLTDTLPGEAKSARCIVIDGDFLNRASPEREAAREYARTTPVIVLLNGVRRQDVDELIAQGMAGCVEITASAEVLYGALRVALAGGIYLPRGLFNAHDQQPAANAGRGIDHANPHAHLTPRQIEVLALLARGRSNKMIARELNVAEATVKTHLTTIFKALNVATRGEASAAAARIAKVRGTQVDSATNGHLYLGRMLVHTPAQRFRAGEILFRKGDSSGELFYVERGTVRLAELGIELGAGSVLGEIGLFSPEHRRTATVLCKTECEMRIVSAADAVRLYCQEPEFALHLLQLIVERLQADRARNG